jgi:DNA polymerase-3 subunit gamma/tau
MLKDKEKCPHTFLFHGETGCGKTTFARIIANELGCTDIRDYSEIDSAQFRGIDTVREIRANCAYHPIGGTVKVYVIDEVHKLTNDAQNAFLKILEDTPKHIYFILCTTEPQKLISTVRGRCSQFQVNLLTDDEMLELLKSVTDSEGKKIPQEVYDAVIANTNGHPRNALTILEQVLSASKSERLEIAKRYNEEAKEGIDLCRALFSQKRSWSTTKKILEGLRDKDAESIRRIVLGYATSILLKNENDLAALALEALSKPLYDVGFPGLVLACYIIHRG